MQPQRWQQVKEVFESACDMAPPERQRYLAQVGDQDPDLRREVESILAAGEQVPPFLDSPAFQSFSSLLRQERPESLIGRRVGPYELTRVIASGGMGTVYHAVRRDGQFEQEVAVKFVRSDMASEDCLQRFRQERRTLASLEHPNIARLLDGGATEDGLPFFVMEYVEGRPIDEYCDDRRLNTAQRLELFRQVCAAVQYAHQNVVVHRDLKPSNIFVTPGGLPKLLDFGIAKVLAPDEAPPPDGPTHTLHPRMTPEYASPEQIRGEPVTTATDVYSLGVVLYELLTSHRPYRVRSGLLHELARTICEVEPQRPSTAVGKTLGNVPRGGRAGDQSRGAILLTHAEQPGKLRKRLAGDIDAIVLTALRKEPRRRYASVEQFSEDIKRHLEGLPVLARRGTWRYRAGKFVRRHRAAVAAGCVVAFTLVSGILVMSRAAAVARRERDAAVRAERFAEQEKANAIVEARKSDRVTKFLQKMLASANPSNAGRDITVREVLEHAAAAVATEFAEDPEAESAVRTSIGETYIGLGRYDDAEPQFRAALEIQRRLHGEDHWDVANALNGLGVLYYFKRDLAGAEEYCAASLAINRRLYGDEHPSVATALNNLGVLVRSRGDALRAGQYLQEALRIRRKLHGDESLEVAETLNNLARLLLAGGELDQAAAMSREALGIRRKLLGDAHPRVAQSVDNLASVLHAQGDLDAAERLMREALASERELLGNEHPEVAVTLHNLAGVLIAKADYAAAETLLREALHIRNRALPPTDQRTAETAVRLADCLASMSRYEEAERLLLDIFATLDSPADPADARTQSAVQALIHLYTRWGRPEQAAKYAAMLSSPSAE